MRWPAAELEAAAAAFAISFAADDFWRKVLWSATKSVSNLIFCLLNLGKSKIGQFNMAVGVE